jgi:hypothetical protein
MKELYEQFVAPHLRNYRPDWDNFSEDVCYISPDPFLRSKAAPSAIKHEKKPEQQTWVEENAHRSPYHCSKVCEYEGYKGELPEPGDNTAEPDDMEEEGETQDKMMRDSTSTQDKMEDSGNQDEPEDLSLKKFKRKTQAKEPPRKNLGQNRKCFQWRYHGGVCCTNRHFTLGKPKKVKSGSWKHYSGWYLEGIQEWIEAAGECKDVMWVMPH